MKAVNNLKTVHQIQQFYYREARMLDERQFQSWIDLLAPGIEYTMPNRSNCGVDIKLKNKEEILNIDQELSTGLQPHIRDDNLMTLTFRANRPTSGLSMTDNPLTRTRRSISNIEIYKHGHKTFKVYNNVNMSYSKYEKDNHQYNFQRQDVLQVIDGGLKILQRKIIIEWNVITAPTLAMIL
ncbi:MAG: hypothetical protein HRU20_23025 [Pseudomonadales bacterium]|nr:hypothetical protein [Pseudomonadales bacterium]